MNRSILKALFTAAFLFFLYTVIAKILHAEGADMLLIFGLIGSFSCFAFVLYEVLSAQSMKTANKLLWLLGLFMIGWPVMLVYIFTARKGNNNNISLRTT